MNEFFVFALHLLVLEHLREHLFFQVFRRFYSQQECVLTEQDNKKDLSLDL